VTSKINSGQYAKLFFLFGHFPSLVSPPRNIVLFPQPPPPCRRRPKSTRQTLVSFFRFLCLFIKWCLSFFVYFLFLFFCYFFLILPIIILKKNPWSEICRISFILQLGYLLKKTLLPPVWVDIPKLLNLKPAHKNTNQYRVIM